MGLLYRDDIFSASTSSSVPETWDAYAEAALKLTKDKPGTFMTDFGAGDAGWVAAVLWQKGWRPFHLDGTDIQHRDQRPERQGLGQLLAEADRRQGGRHGPGLDHASGSPASTTASMPPGSPPPGARR